MNKITLDYLKQQIANVQYHQLDGTTITIAVITLHSGFTVTGESACVDPTSFNEEIGNKIAYDNAFDKLWQLFGFELKQKIGGDWRYRLQRERDELAERLEKLDSFFEAGTTLVTKEQYDLMKDQQSLMKKYLAVLDTRLA